MEITILGSGCGIPSLDRRAPSILICVKNHQLLFDSGSGTLVRLLKAGINYTNLEQVFYTHTHSDHCADLVPLLQALWTTPDFKRTAPMYLYGPLGFSDFMEKMEHAFGEWVTTPNFPLFVQELHQTEIAFSDFSVQSLPMKHSDFSNGYRIENKLGKSVVYSGDTDYNENIIKLARDADVLVLECSFPGERKTAGHLVPTEAAEIAKQSNCKKLVLTHFYPPYEKLEKEIINVIPKIYNGELVIAYDFLKIIV
ncbi:MBL fold metallo-hydrolase [candidate division KSB1 bacterium]|nr:MBL fold metallo-hydrolase [candidate division KSB1 bacterium]MBL7094648.1 MBL fold metallo-hydrolase [candidate division KSB1 bacterium]